MKDVKSAEAKTFALHEPLKRGSETIKELTIRKLTTGALRGLSLAEVVRMDTDSIIKLLPRITSPALTEAEAKQLSVADVFEAGSEIVGFLLPKAAQVD